VVGYNTAACCVMDTETGQVVTRLDTAQDPVSGQVNNYLDKASFRQGCGSVFIFFHIRIRIQHLRMDTNPDPDPVRIQGFNDQKLKKNYSWKKITFFLIKNCNLPIPKFFLIKNCNLPFPRPP
jgi:hypothetical protein